MQTTKGLFNSDAPAPSAKARMWLILVAQRVHFALHYASDGILTVS